MCNRTSWFGPVLHTFTEIQKCAAQFDALLRASYKYAVCIDVHNCGIKISRGGRLVGWKDTVMHTGN